MSYLNVAEVETALQLAAGPANAGFTERITLPRIRFSPSAPASSRPTTDPLDAS